MGNDEEKAKEAEYYLSVWEMLVLLLIANRLGQIRKSKDISSINIYQWLQEDMKVASKQLDTATALTIASTSRLLLQVAEEEYKKNRPLYVARGIKFTAFKNTPLLDTTNSVVRNVAAQIKDLTKTKAKYVVNETGRVVSLADGYKATLEKAIKSITDKNVPFNQAMRETVKALGGSGVKVGYESGIVRNIDTMARQTILYGTKQVYTANNVVIAKELGCDGIEIDWHTFPRPSHEFMQGKQYSLVGAKTVNGVYYESADEALERLQDYNCLHYQTPIILGVSEPTYTDEELAQLNKDNAKKFKIGDKTYTGYECKQAMRRLETEMRKQKRIRAMARTIGDKKLTGDCNRKIDSYMQKYRELSQKTGLKIDYQRINPAYYK